MPDDLRSRNGQGSVARDAWVVDGFAPLPGDTISLPDDARGTVETVYLCSEPGGDGDLTRWTWATLTDGRLIEVAPRGCALYDVPQVLKHGTGRYLELVAQDGALVRFEERVREGTWQDRPVRLTLGRRRWRLTSTGTAAAQRLGPAPASAWGQLRTPHLASRSTSQERDAGSPSPPLPRTGEGAGGRGTPSDLLPEEQDVYFTLAGLTDPNAIGLGLWATDVILAFGRRLGNSPSASGLRVIPL